MYSGSKEDKGEANHRKKCSRCQDNEQGKGGNPKGDIKGKLRGYSRETSGVSGERKSG